MFRGAHFIFLFLPFGLGACGLTQSSQELLPRAVSAYNDFLRWKKYDAAARFRLPEEQAAFAARYLAAEEDLNIDSTEVRGVTPIPTAEGQPQAAVVTVVVHAYLLPSTVLEKVIMQQRWELRSGNWLLIDCDRELVPPLDRTPLDVAHEAGEPPATVAAPEAGGAVEMTSEEVD